MPLHIIETIKEKAAEITQSSFLYNWSLNQSTPDRLVVRPVDPWTGDAEKAHELLNAAGVGERTGAIWFDQWWSPQDADDIWQSHMHGFCWLRDLRALDGALAREQGRLMIENWIDNYNIYDSKTWQPNITGSRLAMWISHSEFFCANATTEFEDKFLSSIIKQANHLSKNLNKTHNIDLLESIKGLLYAAISFENHEKWVEQALNALKITINAQILPDGGHISRSPALLLDALKIMVEMRIALKSSAYPIPEFLSTTIENMSCALRLFRYRDRKFGLFNSTQEGDISNIDAVLAQAGTYKRARKSLENMGFERIELGKSLLVINTGKSPNSPYDKHVHASPLAFEFCYGKDRLITSCGSHPLSKEWQEALRSTSAHSTACIDYRNACEIKKNGHLGRKITKATIEREETKEAVLLCASHNGYAPLNGITHTRKIYLSDEGNDLRGEDSFHCIDDLGKPAEIALRFHIHPNVSISLINDGREVLLRMTGGIGWRFRHSLGDLKIEDSLYLGNGISHKKTSQIVIYGQMSKDNACINWSLKREG